jgi:hypothetical protein
MSAQNPSPQFPFQNPFQYGPLGDVLGKYRARGTASLGLASAPARVLVKKGLGLDKVSWGALLLVTGFFAALQFWQNLHFGWSLFSGPQVRYDHFSAIRNAGLVVLGVGFLHRRVWFAKERRGTAEVPDAPGESWFSFLPLPDFILDVVVDPLVCCLAGLLLQRFGFFLLGLLLIVSACALCLSEAGLYAQLIRYIRVMRGYQTMGLWQAAMLAQGASRVTDITRKTGGAAATGADAVTALEIEKRRREAEAAGNFENDGASKEKGLYETR